MQRFAGCGARRGRTYITCIFRTQRLIDSSAGSVFICSASIIRGDEDEWWPYMGTETLVLDEPTVLLNAEFPGGMGE